MKEVYVQLDMAETSKSIAEMSKSFLGLERRINHVGQSLGSALTDVTDSLQNIEQGIYAIIDALSTMSSGFAELISSIIGQEEPVKWYESV